MTSGGIRLCSASVVYVLFYVLTFCPCHCFIRYFPRQTTAFAVSACCGRNVSPARLTDRKWNASTSRSLRMDGFISTNLCFPCDDVKLRCQSRHTRCHAHANTRTPVRSYFSENSFDVYSFVLSKLRSNLFIILNLGLVDASQILCAHLVLSYADWLKCCTNQPVIWSTRRVKKLTIWSFDYYICPNSYIFFSIASWSIF